MWYIGVPVGNVTLEDPSGGLPDANLLPLLSVVAGDPLDPGDVRHDLAILMRAGEFASARALAEPWFTLDEAGNPSDAVRVIYQVERAPRIAEIRLRGVGGVARTIVREALALQPGAIFYAGDEEPARQRAEQVLRARGWPQATVAVSRTEGPEGIEIDVRVSRARPERYGDVRVVGGVFDGARDDDGRFARRARRRLRLRHGVRPGRRVDQEALAEALAELREGMVDQGWLGAQVIFHTATGDDDRRGRAVRDLTIIARPDARLTFERERRAGLPRASRLHEVLGIYAGERVTEASTEEFERLLIRWFDERGYRDATVNATAETRGVDAAILLSADRGQRHRLDRIVISGDTTFRDAELAGVLRRAAPQSLGRGVVGGGGLDEARSGLREYYRGHGYLQAEVNLTATLATASWWQRWDVPVVVEVMIDEGPRAHITALETSGGSGLEGPVMAGWRPLLGEPYNPEEIDRLAQEVALAYRNAGHLSADARALVELSGDGEGAEIALQITPQKPVRLRSVVVRGHHRTRQAVIERQLDVEVGQPVSLADIASSRANLYDLDLFRTVSTELMGEDPGTRDLLLRLDEKPRWLFETGGGVSSDQGLQARGQATHRNLGGLGHRASALGQFGYAWQDDDFRLLLAEPVWRASLLYEAPDLPAPRQRLIAELLLLEYEQERTFRLVRSGLGLGLRSELGRRAQLSLDTWGQQRRLDDVAAGALVEGDPWLSLVGLDGDPLGQPALPSEPRWVASVSAAAHFDGRDDRFNATRGLLASGGVSVSREMVGETPVMLRSLVSAEELIPVGRLVLGVGARTGWGYVPGEGTTLSVEDRFTLGGTSSVRGFRLDSLGPANLAGRPEIPFPDQIDPAVETFALREEPTQWVPTGGDAMWSLQVGLRVPLSMLWTGGSDRAFIVVFSDLGSLWFSDPGVTTSSMDDARDQVVRAGLGAGLRLATPIGAVVMDLGVNPWPIAGRDEPLLVPHLSLGQF